MRRTLAPWKKSFELAESYGLNNILVQYCQNGIKGALSIVPNQVFELIVSGISALVNCTSFERESR